MDDYCPHCGKSDYFETARKTFTISGVNYYRALNCNVCGVSWVVLEKEEEEEHDEDSDPDE